MKNIRETLECFGKDLGSFIVKWKYLVVATAIVVSLIITTGADRLGFTPNYRAYFSNENPELNAFLSFQDTYTKNDNFFFVLVPEDGKVFSIDTLSAVTMLTENAWTIPFSNRVDSITNFQNTFSRDGDLVVEDLVEQPKLLTSDELSNKRIIATNEPTLVGQLVDGQGTATAVNVTLQLPGKSLFEVPTAAAKARELKSQIEEQFSGIDVYLTGFGMLNNAFGESAYMDSTTLTPIMYGVLVVVGFLMLRSISGTIATVSVAFLSVGIGLGVGGYWGVLLTPVSTSVPIIILTIAVADSIHIFFAIRRAMKKGMGKEEAIVEALHSNFIPVTITSITTVIGFLTLNYSDAPPYWHVGNLSAVGIAAGWVLSLTLLPAIMAILPYKARKAETIDMVDRFWYAFGGGVAKYSRPILLVGLLSAITFITLVPSLHFNDQWSDYFSKKIEFRRDTDDATKYFGLYPVEFSVPAKGAQGISDPEYLNNLERFVTFLRGQENVGHVFAITDILKRINKNIHDDNNNFYALPITKQEAVDELFLYELSLPYGLDLNDRINIDKSATRVTVTLGKTSTTETKAFIESTSRWIETNLPDYMQNTKPTSAHIMFTYITDRNVESMISGFIMAVVLIGLVLAFSFGSWRLGAVSLISNSIPILIAFGIWSLLVGTVGFSVAAVAAIAIGIVIDDTVHFLHKYHASRQSDQSGIETALRSTFASVGPAITSSSVILICGFLVMASSSFKMNVDLGLLSAITIACALVFDLIFLPAVLMQYALLTKKRSINVQESPSDKNPVVQQTGTALVVLLTATIYLTFGVSDLANAEPSDSLQKGYFISETSDRTDHGFESSEVEVTMVLHNAIGDKATRKLVLKTLEKRNEEEGDKTIGIFYEPFDMKGTALLTHAKILEPDDQWLFMKSLKRVKRISSRNKSGPFLGSEFAYEDFTALELKKYSHEWIREEACNKFTCQVIKRVPQYKYSGYSHILVWIDDEKKQVRKIEFYDRKGELLKTLSMDKYDLDGGYWRSHHWTMENHQTRKVTELIYGDFEFKKGLTDNDFSSRRLTSIQ